MTEPLIKGLFLNSAVDFVRAQSGDAMATALASEAGLPAKISTLRDHPQTMLTQFVKLAAARCFAGVDDNEVVRRFGVAAFDAFASTLVGRVGIGFARNASTANVAKGLARMHNASTRTSTVEAVDVTERGFRLHYEGCVHAWYQLGMTEAGFKGAPTPVDVKLHVVRHAVDERWLPADNCAFDITVERRHLS